MRILTVLLLTLFTFYARAGSGPAQPRKFIKLSSGVKLHYLEAGSGPTVLLLHGFASWSYSWAETIPDLAAHYHVLVPDLMGYGLSDKPANGNYSWATYVEQLK
ncbi:MAG: alpha/beta fold hydrolase, partial [Bdellovibrionia bacterium]